MADFYEVWRDRGSVMEKLELMLKECVAARENELKAAIDIKRVYRGKIVRDDLHQKRAATIVITSTYRGYQGRLRAQHAAEVALERERIAVYHYHALAIQGIFRGYQSRKYKYNHARRKKYLQEVIDAGDAVRAELRVHEQVLLEEERAKMEKTDQVKLKTIARNLHHLVGTKSIAGVFNSPYMREAGRIPTIQGVEVEQYLTMNAKDLLRSRSYVKRGLEMDLNGQMKVPLRGRERRRSIQAQDPYELADEVEAAEKTLSRLKRVGPREFHAGNRIPLAPFKRGINGGTEFMDPWLNPYLVRGVPREQAELSLPLSQTSLGKYPERPYYLSVGGNKSAVLPNGMFDVILEAEQTGGIIRTYNGRSRRYGVPDTCDPDDEVSPGSELFYPPSSAIKQRKATTSI